MRPTPAATLIATVGAAFVLAGTLALTAKPRIPAQGPAQAKPAGMLLQRYTRDFLIEKMLPASGWALFPPAADRVAWDRLLAAPLNQQRRAYLVARAEQLVGRPWPALPATLYMEFARIGNRSHFEGPYFERRANLATLVLAECLEHRGRFLDEIVNGIWAITEEATWCLPAHAARAPKDVLHRQDLESVDLFAAETAMTLATARHLLRRELDAVSPAVGERVHHEVLRRVVDPVASGGPFGSSWWLDGSNNWAPWCASNVLGAGMLLLESPERLAELSVRMMGVADRFIDGYGDDGGCDEGPGYWDEASGALLVLLELLHSRTDGAVDIYNQPKIAAMANFIVHAHIGGPWFLNASDADAKTMPSPGKLYRFGERIGSKAMMNLALLAMRGWDPRGEVTPPIRVGGVNQSIVGPLMAMFWIPADARPASDARPTTVWLPDLQLLAVRESPDVEQGGLYLAARGGHNAESHNHNDVGHFVVYLDNQPAIVDIGRETYTAQTFSGDRYQLWFTRGSAHNTPIVNGVEQAEGRERKATEVAFRSSETSTQLSMSLEQAYPESAGIRSLRREIEFRRQPAAEARVRDTYSLASASSLQVPLYAAQPVRQIEPGRLLIECTPRRLLIEYPAGVFDVAIQPVRLEDPILRSNWGSSLYKVVFTTKTPSTAGSYEFAFRGHILK